jgi:hypothetical protein
MIIFGCGQVKCSIPYKEDGLRLFMFHLWEMASYVDTKASFNKMWDWKKIRENEGKINGMKGYEKNEISPLNSHWVLTLVCNIKSLFLCSLPAWFLVKAKAILVTGRGGPLGREKSRLPHFVNNRFTDGGEVVTRSLTEEHSPRPREFQNRVLRRIFGQKRDK